VVLPSRIRAVPLATAAGAQAANRSVDKRSSERATFVVTFSERTIVSAVLSSSQFPEQPVAKSTSKTLETVRPAGYIELLRGNFSFRQVWLGQVVSQMGDWFNTIALYTIILNLTGSGRAVGGRSRDQEGIDVRCRAAATRLVRKLRAAGW